MPKVVVDLPVEYMDSIAQVCGQEELAQTEFFLEALKASLFAKGLYPRRSIDRMTRTRAIEIQDMLAAGDTDYESHSLQEIMEWRRSLTSRE